METLSDKRVSPPRPRKTFNFLASLINGNVLRLYTPLAWFVAFNFLASLINGNRR